MSDDVRIATQMGLRTVAFEKWMDAHIPLYLGGALLIRIGKEIHSECLIGRPERAEYDRAQREE